MSFTEPSTSADREQNDLFWVIWVVLAAFGSYFCMYGFRKPFTAGSYSDTEMIWGIGFKTILVTSQVAGYMLSKVIGIKIISEMPPRRRALTLLCLVLAAEGALVLFGLVPRPWNAACLFLNGLPLGMVWGLIQGFLEGRRLTELLVAGLCASFIVADGVTKTVGSWLLRQGVTEDWMPSVAGCLFLAPLAIFVAMLTRISPPTADDVAARSCRSVMDRSDRLGFLRRHAWGLMPLLLMYLLVTIVRSIRADFAPEIWKGLGSAAVPSTFTNSEMLVALGVLVVNGGAVLIRNNRYAFLASLMTCGLGFLLSMIGLLARDNGVINGFTFMVLIGLGLYLPYVAMHTTVFERLLSMTRDRGNVGFLMYLADSAGYFGYVLVMITRNFLPIKFDVLALLTMACWAAIGLSVICLLMSWRYFARVEAVPSSMPATPVAAEVVG